jgi:hypothetical protein
VNWLATILDRLTVEPLGGYTPAGPPATEPIAIAALALTTHQHHAAAEVALAWLTDNQAKDGSLGITATESQPRWPTAWAALAWSAASASNPPWRASRRRAIAWILKAESHALENNPWIQHDASLIGWPWVEGTHAWVQPTSLSLLALRATGHGGHPRASLGRRILLDRQLPHGGWNYGNRIVLGQELRPHVEPTALALLALAPDAHSGVISRPGLSHSLDYLEQTLSDQTATISLCFGLMALEAHGRDPRDGDTWLEAAAKRNGHRHGSLQRFALLALAARRESCPLTRLQRLSKPPEHESVSQPADLPTNPAAEVRSTTGEAR